MNPDACTPNFKMRSIECHVYRHSAASRHGSRRLCHQPTAFGRLEHRRFRGCNAPLVPLNSHSKLRTCAEAHHDTRRLHNSSKHLEAGDVASQINSIEDILPPPSPPHKDPKKPSIRARLRQWQQEQASEAVQDTSQIQPPSSESALTGFDRPDIQINNDEDLDDSFVDTFTQEFDRLSGQYEGATDSEADFRPGDVLQLPGGADGSLLLAVHLKSTQNYNMMYDLNGNICAGQFGQAHFIAPQQFTREEIEPLFKYVPESPFFNARDLLLQYGAAVPRDVGAPILERLMRFRATADEAFRAHSNAMNNVHSLVAHPTETRLMSLEDIAAKVVGVPPEDAHALPQPVLLAVSHSLVRNAFGFKISNRQYAHTRILTVESKYSMDVVKRVMDWTRCYQEESSLRSQGKHIPDRVKKGAKPLHNFVQRAQGLIRVSNDVHLSTPDGSVIGTSPKYSKEPRLVYDRVKGNFSEQERDIVHFLSLYVCARSFFYHPVLVGMPAIITRAVGIQTEELEVNVDTVHTLLVRMGAMQPFDNPDSWDRDLYYYEQELEDKLKGIQAQIQSGVPVDEAASLTDSMADMRKDWGDLPVLCIDSQSTTEIDDGISLEEIPGSSDVWIHVHVAHPSAFTTPDHTLARCAGNRLLTAYLPEGKISMLPSYMSDKFSVQSGAPVLTTSTRLDANGDVVESSVTAGKVSNVVYVNQDTVDQFFNYESTSEGLPSVLSAGNGRPSSTPSEHHSTSQASHAQQHGQTLTRLLELAKKLESKRPKPLFWSRNEREVLDVSSPTPHHSPLLAHRHIPPPTKPHYTLDFPSIDMKVNPTYDMNLLAPPKVSPSSVLVSEMMILANTRLARYCADREIPIPYYGTRRLSSDVEETVPAMRERLERIIKGEEQFERGFIKFVKVSFGLMNVKAHPTEHRVMGLEVYAKASSSLRRFTDLVTGWQVDAALREEHRLGHSLLDASKPSTANTPNDHQPAPAEDDESPEKTNITFATHPQPYLPFSRSALQSLLDRIHHPSLGRLRFLASHQKHHIMQAFARALYLSPERITPYVDPTLEPSTIDPRYFNVHEGRFIAIMGKSGSARRQGRLEGLEVQCDSEDALGSKDGRTPVEGERWAVKVQRVRLGSKRVVVKLLRKVE